DSIPWTVVVGLGEQFVTAERCAQTRAPFEKSEGRSRILPCDRFAALVRLIIPQGGIAGSNPAPATNLNPAAARQGFYYAQRNTLPGLRPAKHRRAVLHRVE